MFGNMLSDIIKTATLTLIWNKSLTMFGKKEYGEMIKVSGMSICGVDIIKLIAYWRENPPMIIKIIKGIDKFFSK